MGVKGKGEELRIKVGHFDGSESENYMGDFTLAGILIRLNVF